MSQILQKVAPIGEARDREILREASTYIYRNDGGIELLAHVFFPADRGSDALPVLVFFHGGFWDTAMPTQFVPHCHHFASRGAVSVTFEYRVQNKHQTGPLEALDDAAHALRWLHENAETLGIDAEKMGFVGAAGGAWLGLVLAMRKDKELAPEDILPAKPKALVLFSALLDTSAKGMMGKRFPDRKSAKKNSPRQLLRRKLPPMLFFHGKADRITPFEQTVSFCKSLRWRRNPHRLVDFNGADHSFFNFNVSHSNFEMTIAAADRFFVEQGLLAEETAEKP